MKATTKIQMAVLAVAVCAFVSVPASAFAWLPDMPELPDMPSFEIPTVEIAKPAPHDIHLVGPVDIHEFVPVESEEATLGEPPVEPADEPVGEPAAIAPLDPTHAPDVPSITATPSVTTTPTPTIPERPYLPFTGGDATPYLLAGMLVALAGGALILVPAVVRKANAR